MREIFAMVSGGGWLLQKGIFVFFVVLLSSGRTQKTGGNVCLQRFLKQLLNFL